ncbi:hypothetical protein JCM8547_003749 [Rhodosporidiobolus lusitaniae]
MPRPTQYLIHRAGGDHALIQALKEVPVQPPGSLDPRTNTVNYRRVAWGKEDGGKGMSYANALAKAMNRISPQAREHEWTGTEVSNALITLKHRLGYHTSIGDAEHLRDLRVASIEHGSESEAFQRLRRPKDQQSLPSQRHSDSDGDTEVKNSTAVCFLSLIIKVKLGSNRLGTPLLTLKTTGLSRTTVFFPRSTLTSALQALQTLSTTQFRAVTPRLLIPVPTAVLLVR